MFSIVGFQLSALLGMSFVISAAICFQKNKKEEGWLLTACCLITIIGTIAFMQTGILGQPITKVSAPYFKNKVVVPISDYDNFVTLLSKDENGTEIIMVERKNIVFGWSRDLLYKQCQIHSYFSDHYLAIRNLSTDPPPKPFMCIPDIF